MPTVIAMTPGRRARRWRRMRGPLGLLTLWLALATWALGSSVGVSPDPDPVPALPVSVHATGGVPDDMPEPDALRPTWSEEGPSEEPVSSTTGATGMRAASDEPAHEAALYSLGR